LKISNRNGTRDISCQKANPTTIGFNYIYLKSHKKSKRQTPEKRFALIGNDITNNLGSQKLVIYSRYSNLKKQNQLDSASISKK
jgi:hypothetical protein